jgi:catechol 2,3-dioxygenase-like lactoylglutathione lyase family enzyme
MPAGFHHVTLNVTDLARSRAFYEGLLGLTVDQDFPGRKVRLRTPDGGRLVLASALPGTPPDDRFDEHRIGLDHIALGVPSRAELDRLLGVLQQAGVPADLHHDALGPAMISFRDPDNIQLELFEVHELA